MKKVFLVALTLLLSSCASVMGGGRQNVTVITPEADGAMCSLSDSKGRVHYIESTPGTALVHRGDGPISVICHKEGYKKAVGMIEENIAGASYGNLALGPAFLIGYAVDGMTGSAQKYDSSVTIEMERMSEMSRKAWEDEDLEEDMTYTDY